MKAIGMVSAAVLILLLGAIPARSWVAAQQEESKPAEQPAHEANPSKPSPAKLGSKPAVHEQQKQERDNARHTQQAQEKQVQEQAKHAQDEAKHAQKAQEKQVQEQSKRTQDEAKRVQQDQQKNQQKQAQEQAKQAQEQSKRAQKDDAKRAQDDAKRNHQEQQHEATHQQQAQASPARGDQHGDRSARIPDDRFRAHFGHEHRFAINHPVFVAGRPRFQYGGYWFEILDPWPADWSYSDECYIDYVDDGYYLFDPLHPGFRIAVVIAM